MTAIEATSENTWIDSDNARIFGGDLDSVWVGDYGAVMPAGDSITKPENHENIGWLAEDGITLGHDDNEEVFKGHQGGRTIRKKVTSSEDSFKFIALESTLLTFGLINDIKSHTTTSGVSRIKVSGAKKSNDRRSWIVDTWDGEIWYRYLIPSGEVGQRAEEVISNSAIRQYEVTVTVYGSYEVLTNDPAMAKPVSDSL